MADYKPLWSYLREFLSSKGFSKICFLDRKILKKKLFRENILQAIVVDMLLYNRCIGSRPLPGKTFVKCIELLGSGNTVYYPGDPGSCIYSPEDLLRVAGSRPLFVIDNRLYYELHEKDRERLVLQTSLFLKNLRRYLFDSFLIINSSPKEFISRFNGVTGLHKARVYEYDVLPSIIDSSDYIVALDPYADKVLDESVLRRATIVVIGGIVDREKPLSRATTRIIEELEDSIDSRCRIESYRIEIDGVREAIPHRINILGEILFKTMFLGESLRNSIIENMSNRDIAHYIGYLLLKKRISVKEIPLVKKELEEIRGSKISDHVVKRALKIAGVRV